MKILFLVRSLGFGGAESQLVALAQGLRARGHEVVVAQFYGGYPLEGQLRDAGVQVRSLDKRGRWDIAGFLMNLARLVRQEKPDIVHSYLADPNILSTLLKLVSARPKVVWGVRASARDLKRYERFVRTAFRAQCFLSRYADLIIANSSAGMADHLAQGFPAGKTVVIPNGVDSLRFHPDADARKRVRAEFGIRDDQPLIGLVARLDPMKDHETFLHAAASVASQRPDARFLCVGNGRKEEHERLQLFGRSLRLGEAVTWLPARADVDAVYNSLDVLVSSSRWGEGFSNVIAEAMACEVPCVVTDVGDSRLIVGATGLVVRPRDPSGLASSIVALLSEDSVRRASRGRAARSRIVAEFSVELLVQRTELQLLRLMSGQAGHPA